MAEANPEPVPEANPQPVPEEKRNHFLLGPLKLKTTLDNVKRTVFVVIDRNVSTDEETGAATVGDDCTLRVFGYPKSSSTLPRLSHRVKEEYVTQENLLYDLTLKSSTVLSLESYESKNKTPKLALVLPSNKKGVRQEDYIFKSYNTSKPAALVELKAILREGPFKDMKQVDVFISPDQEIPAGLALINVFSSHLCVVNRHNRAKPVTRYPIFYKQKKRRNTIPCAHIETRPLPLVVTYEELNHFDPLEAGLRFEVANKMHFLRCDHETALEVIQHFELHKYGEAWPPVYFVGGDPDDDLESIPSTDSRSTASEDIHIPVPGQSLDIRPRYEEDAHIYKNEFITRRCETDPKEGFMANIGVFGGKPTVGGDWLLQVFICPLKKSQEEIRKEFANQQREVVCTLRAFQVVRDVSVSISLKQGWSHDGDTMMEVSKEELHSALEGSSQFLHDICLQHEDVTKKRFRGSIIVRQGMEKTLTLNILTDYEQNSDSLPQDDSDTGVPTPETSADGKTNSWPLPFSKRKRMCELLDVECIYGNDWRLFAEKIGLDCQKLPVIASSNGSHTDNVLTLWKQGHTDKPYDKPTLVEILQEMGRPDVIQDLQLIEPFVQSFIVLTVTDHSIQVGWEPGSPDLTHCNLYINRTARMDVLLCKKYTVKIEEKKFTFRDLPPATQHTISIEPLVQLVRGEQKSVWARTRPKESAALPVEN